MARHFLLAEKDSLCGSFFLEFVSIEGNRRSAQPILPGWKKWLYGDTPDTLRVYYSPDALENREQAQQALRLKKLGQSISNLSSDIGAGVEVADLAAHTVFDTVDNAEAAIKFVKNPCWNTAAGLTIAMVTIGGRKLLSKADDTPSGGGGGGRKPLTDPEALAGATRARNANVQAKDIKGALPNPTGQAGHALSKHGFSNTQIADIINTANRKFICVNKNCRQVIIFLKGADVVITQMDDVTRVITAYGPSGVTKTSGGKVTPGKPVSPNEWLNDPFCHEVL